MDIKISEVFFFAGPKHRAFDAATAAGSQYYASTTDEPELVFEIIDQRGYGVVACKVEELQ